MSKQTIINIQVLIWKEFGVDDDEEAFDVALCEVVVTIQSILKAFLKCSSVCVSVYVFHTGLDKCAR